MRDITLCHPRLQALTAQLVDKCVSAGLPIKIGESFRASPNRTLCTRRGGLQPGSIITNARGSSYSSQHQWGIAADFTVPMEKAHTMKQEIISTGLERSPSSWGLHGEAIGKAS